MSSIAKRPNGKYRARYYDDEGKQHARHFERKKDAQDWLDSVTVAVRTGAYVDPVQAKMTLATFYADWSLRQVWAPGTLRAMNTSMSGCTFANVELGKLRRSHVESWVKTLSTTLAPGTVRTRYNNVRSVLRAAVRDRLLSSDPSEGTTLPRQRRAEHAMRLPTPEQVGLALAEAEEWFEPLIAVCAFAGLRIGEAAGLQMGDFDFLRRRLHVQRQVQHVGAGEVSITPPKYGSERVVNIPTTLVEMIARHMEVIGDQGKDGWLFPSRKTDVPSTGESLRYYWGKTVAAIGLEEFTPHDLRHFYASGLIAAGCDVVTVQRALGHAKATTTLDTYSHLWPTAEDRTRAAAADLMGTAIKARDSLGTAEPATA